MTKKFYINRTTKQFFVNRKSKRVAGKLRSTNRFTRIKDRLKRRARKNVAAYKLVLDHIQEDFTGDARSAALAAWAKDTDPDDFEEYLAMVDNDEQTAAEVVFANSLTRTDETAYNIVQTALEEHLKQFDATLKSMSEGEAPGGQRIDEITWRVSADAPTDDPAFDDFNFFEPFKVTIPGVGYGFAGLSKKDE